MGVGEKHAAQMGAVGLGGFQQADEDKGPVIDSTLGVLPVPGCPGCE